MLSARAGGLPDLSLTHHGLFLVGAKSKGCSAPCSDRAGVAGICGSVLSPHGLHSCYQVALKEAHLLFVPWVELAVQAPPGRKGGWEIQAARGGLGDANIYSHSSVPFPSILHLPTIPSLSPSITSAVTSGRGFSHLEARARTGDGPGITQGMWCPGWRQEKTFLKEIVKLSYKSKGSKNQAELCF